MKTSVSNIQVTKTSITIRLTPSVAERLREWADRHERSLNWSANKAIEQFLQREEPVGDPTN